ncbi:tyrosine-protein phosphatase [Fusobacterium sp. MFO224]|uniref:tyrosine-protein phosphatase n=1 Tax=Fusobacterium sp. MFO224 TaxID=3378070 RepID=UPI0038534420
MIDIHSHVLFAVDDGAKNLEESIKLIEEAVSLGYTGIVCSAHYKISKFENRRYDEKFNILKEEVLKRKLPISLYKGNELDLREKVLKVLDNVYTINDTRYILVEFSRPLIYEAYIKIIDALIERGYIPILAHVERYPYIKLQDFMKLYDKKVIFQMNLTTVKTMSKKVKFLLEEGYIQVVGTDAHRVGSRDYSVLGHLNKLKKIVGEERFLQLTKENPRKIVMNEDINLETRREKKRNEKVLSFNGVFRFIFRKLFNGINGTRCNSKG